LTETAAPDVKSKRFRWVDRGYLAMIILPILVLIVLKVLFTPLSEEGKVNIAGALVYFCTDPVPGVTSLYISESQVNSWAVMISILGLCLYLTHGLTVRPGSKRQLVAEWAVEQVNKLVSENMGQRFMAFAPFVAAIMLLSAFSSLTSLIGLFPPTSDMNVVAGWAILVFILITHYKLKGGFWPYFKGFFEPVPIFAPFNIIGEIATPVSMSFRHYGNVLSGVVISTLVAYALRSLSHMLFSFLGNFTILQIGLPAVLSIYFDIFSGLMQAFIFAMLTMLYVGGGFPLEDWLKRHPKRQGKRAEKAV
jgi:F-type H+-transporting ATPase subunit a